MLSNLAVVYVIMATLMSLVTFIAYGIDKRRAIRERRRIPEATLHLYAALCGWPGALLGQRVFRHKTQKLSFKVVLWAIILGHLILIGLWLWALLNRAG